MNDHDPQHHPYQSPDFNPYQTPEYFDPINKQVEIDPLPCPRCQSTGAKPAPYNGWHGRRAPKAIQDVVCQKCGANFNGETGVEYPPRKSPLVWFLLALGLFLAYEAIIFLVAFLG